jgi:hypothetical protein
VRKRAARTMWSTKKSLYAGLRVRMPMTSRASSSEKPAGEEAEWDEIALRGKRGEGRGRRKYHPNRTLGLVDIHHLRNLHTTGRRAGGRAGVKCMR